MYLSGSVCWRRRGDEVEREREREREVGGRAEVDECEPEDV